MSENLYGTINSVFEYPSEFCCTLQANGLPESEGICTLVHFACASKTSRKPLFLIPIREVSLCEFSGRDMHPVAVSMDVSQLESDNNEQAKHSESMCSRAPEHATATMYIVNYPVFMHGLVIFLLHLLVNAATTLLRYCRWLSTDRISM